MTPLLAVAAASGQHAPSNRLLVSVAAASEQYVPCGANLQECMKNVTSGATIFLPAGTLTYSDGNCGVDFAGKEVTVQGNGSARTTIDCEGQSYAFWLQSSEGPGAVIQDLTIFNATGSDGSALKIDPASPAINRVAFVGNGSPRYPAGAAYIDGTSSPTFTDVNFTDNLAYQGGAVDIQSAASPTFTRCAFLRNTAVNDLGGMTSCTRR